MNSVLPTPSPQTEKFIDEPKSSPTNRKISPTNQTSFPHAFPTIFLMNTRRRTDHVTDEPSIFPKCFRRTLATMPTPSPTWRASFPNHSITDKPNIFLRSFPVDSTGWASSPALSRRLRQWRTEHLPWRLFTDKPSIFLMRFSATGWASSPNSTPTLSPTSRSSFPDDSVTDEPIIFFPDDFFTDEPIIFLECFPDDSVIDEPNIFPAFSWWFQSDEEPTAEPAPCFPHFSWRRAHNRTGAIFLRNSPCNLTPTDSSPPSRHHFS